MKVSINQPCYLGWMGYFDRIRKSDLHIVLDHVQFEKGSYTNRCRIKQRDGREMWLTVPVEKGKPINATHITDLGCIKKHQKSLYQAYGVTDEMPYGHNLLWTLKWRTLWLLNRLQVPSRLEYSSHLGGNRLGCKSELVLNLCKEVGATQYLSGPQGRNYLDLPSFDKAGIEVLYHDYPSDGDNGLSAVHHLFTGAVQWEQTSQAFSRDSAAEAGAPVVPQDPAVPRPALPAVDSILGLS